MGFGTKLKKVLKKVLPVAALAANFIPGIGPVAGKVIGGIGALMSAGGGSKGAQGAQPDGGIADLPRAFQPQVGPGQFSEVPTPTYSQRPAVQGNLYEASVTPLAASAPAPAGIGSLPRARFAVPEEMFGAGPSIETQNMAYGGPVYMAQGGLAGLAPQQYAAGGRFLSGPGDGTSDSIRANIEGKQEARLADGEFVLPADIVSHIGNGSSKAGAEKLYKMMDQIRRARTGTAKMGKTIKADKYLPA